MKTWNVLTGVVQLIEAETAEEARRQAHELVAKAVDSFGDAYDLDCESTVFESETLR